MSVKQIIVGGVPHKIDYSSLENLPELPPKQSMITFAHEVVELTSKGKPKVVKYDEDGKITAIEILRYACPERVDNEPETHLQYLKDERLICGRDGDFGFPEIDKTGQINFRPSFNGSGYVVLPTGTDALKYNKFKSPWCTGIEGVYRFTKVNSDLDIHLLPVLESTIPAYEVTYKIVAPEGYGIPENEEDDSVQPIPSVRVFRCKDQTEKYALYIIGDKPHSTLSEELCSGEVLEFTQDAEAPGEGLVGFTATKVYKACSDISGLPSNNADGTDEVSVYFNIENINLREGDTIAPASTAGKPKDISDKTIGYAVEEISGSVTVTITIAPPVTISLNDESVREVEVDPETGNPVIDANGNNKIIYGFENKLGKKIAYEFSSPLGGDFDVKIVRGYEIAKVDGVVPRNEAEAINELIESITVDGTPITVNGNLVLDEATAKKDNFKLKGSVVTGDVVITLKTRPVHANA